MTKTKILNKILEIENKLNGNWKTIDDFSFFTGIGGLPVFYLMLFTLTKDKTYFNKIQEIVEVLFERLNNKSFGMAYDSGLTGLAYLFDFLNNHQLLDENIEDTLVFLDDAILKYTKNNLKSYQDIDFLHGSLGAANYLLKRNDKNPKNQKDTILIFERISKIINEDISKTIKTSNLLEFDENTHRTNCGLAHGHISNIIIFSKFLSKFKDNNIIKEALQYSIKCLLSFKTNDETTLASFPSIAITQKTASYNIPLGWCYGDQTISLGLYRAAQVLNDKRLCLEALNIARRTLKRDTFIKAYMSTLTDAGFCHGASSLAYLHKKWFNITGENEFNVLYIKFIQDVIDKGNDELGIAGYRKYMGNGEYENSIGLLDGIIGIGVVLIDYLLEDTVSFSWDEFFLLD